MEHCQRVNYLEHATEASDGSFSGGLLEVMIDIPRERNDTVRNHHANVVIRHLDIPVEDANRPFGNLVVRVFLIAGKPDFNFLCNCLHTVNPAHSVFGGCLGSIAIDEAAQRNHAVPCSNTYM